MDLSVMLKGLRKARCPLNVLFALVLFSISVRSEASDPDFQARCRKPGVVKCFGFDDHATTDRFITPPWGQTAKRGTVVPDIKASGDGSLRFEIPAKSTSDSSGAFWQNFSDDLSVQFGEGQEFYVQWRQRFSPEFLTTTYQGSGGWKQMGVGEGDRPGQIAHACTPIQLVVQNSYQRGFAQMYHSCGEKDNTYEGLEVRVENPFDFLLQNGVTCSYAAVSASGGDKSKYIPPCVGYQPDQWMTFQVHVKVGTWYKNDRFYRKDSTVQLWVAEEGQPSKLVIDRSPESGTGYDLVNTNPAARYGKVWFLPYQTGKNSSQLHPTAYTWYDELIISTTRIPDPK